MKNTSQKKYKFNLAAYITIPFTNAPLLTLIIILDKIITALVPSLLVIFTARFLDSAIELLNNTAGKEQIIKAIAAIVCILAYQHLSPVFIDIVNGYLFIRLTTAFNKDIMNKHANLEYKYIENADTCDVINRVCTEPSEKILNGFDQILSVIYLTGLYASILVIIMRYVWWAGIILILCSVPLIIISYKAGKRSYNTKRSVTNNRRRADYLSEILSSRECAGERTVFSYSDEINTQWYDKYKAVSKLILSMNKKNFIIMKSTASVITCVNIFIVLSLLFSLSKNMLTTGLFMSLTAGIFNLVDMMSWRLPFLVTDIAKIKEYINDMSAFFGFAEKKSAVSLPSKTNNFVFENIIFKNVSFAYPDTNNYILNDCSFEIEAKKHYAFVGVNGAGKTTVTKLLIGLYDNYEGEILINGKSIKEYDLSQLKRLFSVVFQDFSKYYLTIRDNIKLGNVLVENNEKIKTAATLSGLTGLLSKLDSGLTTHLGKIESGGIDLSGGEWQRIAIARNLYSDAQIRILDEPTASLDPIIESEIFDMFNKASIGECTVVITHRLGAARMADEILVFDEGHIVEKGNHLKLLEQKGLYYTMYERQREWYE
jgi:ATP-binding cassette subfamily B protein